MKVIPDEIRGLGSVVAAVLDPSGVLLEANAGFMRLLGNSPARRIGANVALLFTKPSLNDLAASKASEGGEIHRGSFTVSGADGQSLELPGTAWRTAYGICVIAEYDVEAMRKAMSARREPAQGAAQREVRYTDASLTDPISGAGSREMLDQSLAVEISRVRRNGTPLSAMMASIDDFERICEKGGMATGEKILARFGYLLRLLTRPTDIPTRMEAETFVALLPHTAVDQAAVVARRLDRALEEQDIQAAGGRVSAIFGITQFAPGEDAGTFLKRLQSAVAKAKQSPGDTVGVALI